MTTEYDRLMEQTAGNEYDGLIIADRDAGAASLRNTMNTAVQTPPDRAAKVVQLSNATRLPPAVVNRKFDEVSQRAAVDGNDYDAMLQQSPKLVEFLRTTENASIAQDDLQNMGKLEWMLTAPRRALARGWAQVEFGALRSKSIMNTLSADETRRLKTLKDDMARGGDLGADSWFGKALVGGAQQLPMLFSGIYSGARTGLPTSMGAAAAAAIAGQAGPQIALPEEILTVPAAAVTGYYIGQTAGSARFGFQQESGHAFEEYLQFKDESGRPLDTDIARAAALATGLINAGLESFQLNTLMRTIPGLDKLHGATTRGAVRQALASPTVRGALKELMLGYGKTMAAETLTEVAQRAVTIMSGELGKVASGQAITLRTPREIGADLANEAIEAATAFAYIVAPGPSMRAGQNIMRAREAKKQEAFFTALGEQVGESKVFQRLPDKMRQFVTEATKDGPITHVYVEPETWVEYWQGKGLDPREAAAEIMGESSQYEEAVREGHAIKIPMSDYATRIAPTEHNGFFSREMKLAADGLSAREAEELEKRVADEDAKAQAEKATQDEAVRNDVTEKLVAAGVEKATASQYAATYQALFGTVAQRANLDPVALYQKYGLQIGQAGITPGVGDTMMAQAEKVTQPDLDALSESIKAATSIAELDLRLLPNGVVNLETIAAKKTGGGVGTRAMNALIEFADQHGLTIELSLAEKGHQPIEGGAKTSSPGRLRSFYSRFGFVSNRGRNKDFSRSIYTSMYRTPKKVTTFNQNENNDWLARQYAGRTWTNEDEARANIKRRLSEDNERYAGMFPATDLAIVDALKFTRAKGGKVRVVTPPQKRPSVSWNDELPEGESLPSVDWTARDLADRGTPASVMQEYGRGKGTVYQAWVPVSEIPEARGSDITDGYLDEDSGARDELSHRGSPPPAKIRIGPRGKVDIMDGNHRIAWWRENGYNYIPAYVIDERRTVLKQGAINPVTGELGYADRADTTGRTNEAAQELHTTVAGGNPASGWFSATRLRRSDGNPARFWRGAATNLSPRSFEPERLGGASGRPRAGLGVFFTVSRQEAAGYAGESGVTESFHLDMRNPFVIRIDDVPPFNTFQEATAYREDLRAKGFDGIVIDGRHHGAKTTVIAFDPNQVIHTAVPMTKLFQPAYHGSPHDFDRFSTDKIGTGEGAQAYGWGLYFAENPEVATGYHRELAGDPEIIDFRIGPYQIKRGDEWTDYSPRNNTDLENVKATLIENLLVNEHALRSAHATGKLREFILAEADDLVERYKTDWPEGVPAAQQMRKLLEPKTAIRFKLGKVPGAVYQVDISDEHVARMLDWDKPLRVQPQAVRDAVSSIIKDLGLTEWVDHDFASGQAAYEFIARHSGPVRDNNSAGQENASRALRAAGVPGLKYLDQGSRVAAVSGSDVMDDMGMTDEAERVAYWRGLEQSERDRLISEYRERHANDEGQTRNLVVFDDSIVEITHKNGKPLTAKERKEYLQGGTVADYKTVTSAEQSDDGYVYHATNAERADEIASRGIGVHRPNQFTDQQAWPDGATERRNYFTATAEHTWQFAPEDGRPVLLRVKRDAHSFRKESTGDIYSTKKVAAKSIEYLADDGSWHPLTERAKQALQQGGGERGSIQFGQDRQFRINLLENADLTTFLHESGHFWLEVLGDVVDKLRTLSPDTWTSQQARMVADYDALLKWFGVADRSKIAVKHHEQFARGIEAYFMEGKAPNAELRSTFARFRAWLVSIYRSLNALNVSLTPEVRGVMDRMFATDTEIEAAQQEDQIAPLFASDAELQNKGFSPEFVAAYRKQAQQASDTARDELAAKLVATMRREKQKWYRDERERVRAEVAEEVYQNPVYIALAAMRDQKQPNGDALPEGRDSFEAIKLDRKSLDAVYGDGNWRTLPRGVTAGTGGVHQNLAAEVFGFGSGDALVQALRAAPPMNRVIEEQTDARMSAEFGDPMIDGTMIESAHAAVHNEERSKLIQAEIRALGHLRAQSAPAVAAERARTRRERREGLDTINGSAPSLEAVRAMAEGRIALQRVRDVQPALYLSGARKASAQAIDAAAKGDYVLAASLKQRELLNVELYRAAVKARDEVDATVEYMQTFGDPRKRSRIAKAGQDYLDQIDGFLDRYEFARVPQATLDRRKTLAEWIAQQEKAGQTVTLPADVIEQASKADQVNYKDMSVEELRGVRDSVKHIEHLSRLKNKLLTARRKQDLQEVVDEISASIRDHAKKSRGKRIERRLPTEAGMRFLDSWFASHRKLSSLVRELDGFEDGGALWEYLMRPINEAGNKETEMNADATERLAKLFGVYDGTEIAALYNKEDIPALGLSVTRMERLMMALNWGNDGNRQKLMDGYGWNEQQVQAALDTLTEKDWKFVQSIWDFVGSYWSEIEAKEKRVNGIAPEKVVATPVMTRFGEFSGGYFPIKYGGLRGYADRAKEVAEQMIKGHYARSVTRHGHTQERVQGVERPILLDFGVIFEHVNQVIHDLSHHETLIDVNRLLGSKSIQAAIQDGYGDEVVKQMQGAITDIAAGDIPAQGAFEEAVHWVRTGATIAGLGWNVSTALLQPLGLAQSMVRIGPQWVGRGLSRWLRDAASMENSAAWIAEKSPMMRARARTQLREINEIRNQAGVNTGRLAGWIDKALSVATLGQASRQGIADSFFWLIYKGQQVADIPTWIGAYEKAMSQDPDEKRAIDLADQAVLDAQGGGQMKDLARIQRGGPLLKLWTNFYSYFNVTYNLTVESLKRTNPRSPASMGRMLVDMFLLYTVPATLGALMKEALRSGDDDDPDKLAKKLLRENIAYLFGTMIGLREIGSTIQGYAGYEGPAGTRFFSSLARLGKQIEQGEADAAAMKALNDTAGILFHYPAGQIRRFVEGWIALSEGQSKNPLVLLVGPPKE